MRLEWAEASRPFPGESETGDAAWVFVDEAGASVAVIDGLGHGHEASVAAREAKRALAGLPIADPESQLRACHEALKRTRGAALSLARVDFGSGRLRWTGVGNVDGLLLRSQPGPARKERLLVKSGIVGYSLPALRCGELDFGPGDCLIFSTDGIRGEFSDSFDIRMGPAAAAAATLRGFARDADDALVFVGLFVG
jgi:negative regulator of sigma-B (phosphoserine phosphatase)